ncbi:MAG: FAD-binding and (Fe-S)-binding domain-containing protein, partial [Gemmataceae bacterium]
MDSFLEQQKQDLNKRLRPQLAGELRLDAISRKLYSTDASIYQMQPLGVVLPRTTEDVIATIKAASELKIPLTPRGGGTSLAGQSIGPGLIIDCSKYLNRILDLDPTQQSARIQPGVVLDGLNRAAEKFDLQFGPDVSTSNRANLGGMMGNNSAGARSIHYGKTIDHVLSQKVILSDGSQADLAPLSDEDWKDPSRCAGLLGRIIRGTRQIIEEHRGEIFSRFPRLLRRVSGYNLDILAGVPVTRPPHAPKQDSGLHHLVVGSEGTLAFCVEARVNLVHKPRFRGLLVPQFESLASALQALSVCLEPGPSAVELLDHYLLELTRGNLALRDTTRHLDSRTKAIFMVEFSSEEAAEVEDQVQKLAQRLRSAPGLITTTNAVDPAIRDPLWNLRRASMPLLYGMVGDAKPITFIEDPAVPPERLPEFVSRFKEILQRHDADGSFYGHASVGCLHIRPVMNLKDPAQVAAMPRILEEVTDLVLLHGGSLSGEHGDGFSRSQWNRKMFGPDLYDAFCQVKKLFDPQGLFNPGRIVHAPLMTENLRYPPGYAPAEPTTVMDYSAQAGFLRAIEMCNGSGACRKTQGGTMCPSFRVTLDEQDSPRGRANALRHALADQGNNTSEQENARIMRQPWLQDVFDLCVMCKACKSE